MIRREDAQSEFGALWSVGGIGGREFQVGGVLDGQDVFVGVGGIGGFHAGRLFGVALAGLLRGGAGGECAAHGGEGLRFGIRPAFEFQRGRFSVVCTAARMMSARPNIAPSSWKLALRTEAGRFGVTIPPVRARNFCAMAFSKTSDWPPVIHGVWK
jgi:hypothetical protein